MINLKNRSTASNSDQPRKTRPKSSYHQKEQKNIKATLSLPSINMEVHDKTCLDKKMGQPHLLSLKLSNTRL
ncbi:hypothetical protein GCM10007978_17080 [Shewanella hanedai]|nr:hypothetical protein GCM10007978_17080 [Shewanella hanedai]